MGLFDELKIEKWPEIVRVEQEFNRPKLYNVVECLNEQLKKLNARKLFKPGQSIAVAVGSRAIDSLLIIIKMVIQQLKAWGVNPYVISAMGSHGGACPEGQKDLLDSLGITHHNLGVPVIYDVEDQIIGQTAGEITVHFSRRALESDGIVLINRVKRHTNFRGHIESGLMKMLVVGLGKHKGAMTIHSLGFDDFSKNMVNIGRIILERTKLKFSVGIVENAYDEVAYIEVIEGLNIIEREPELLKIANNNVPRIPFKNIEVLIVCEMGKDISGDGIDPNITGRYSSSLTPDYSQTPKISRIVVLDLTRKSHGSAVGIGYADVITDRLEKKIDRIITYTNAITAHAPGAAKIPVVMPNDKLAIVVALKTCGNLDLYNTRICIIKNTLLLGKMFITKAMEKEYSLGFALGKTGKYEEIKFDSLGNLLVQWE